MKQETALGILKTGRNVYLTGAAGSGKTHVLNQYIEYLRKNRVSVGITASTGIAATHLGGMTIHAWSGVGIKDHLTEWDIDSLTQRQPLVKRFEKASVLLIDEISMLRPELLDMVDQVAKAMKRNDKPFGGLQVILSGDFFQLPPVVRGGGTESFADSASAWLNGDFRVCYLSEQFRREGGELLAILNDIRDGEISMSSQEALESRMFKGDEENEDEIVDDLETDADAVILHTHNKSVDSRNWDELEKLDAQSVTYDMVTAGRASLVESLVKNVLAPESLELKVGARVMFVKNSPEQEYVNGTIGEIIDLDGEYPLVRTGEGKEIMAHPVSWEMTDDGKVLASVVQVPLRLAWAITVHKSQGMSLDTVEVDLSRAFTPGQGYVALSRARTLQGLTIHGLNATALQVHPYVRARDGDLLAESERWDNVFTKFSAARIKEMEDDFIKKVGRTEAEAATETTIPTHLKTRAFLEEGKTIEEIKEVRSMTFGTVVGHLEKLQKNGDCEIYAHVEPDSTVVAEITKAFDSFKEMKLAPVHKKLKGKYTYEELRLARLFISE